MKAAIAFKNNGLVTPILVAKKEFVQERLKEIAVPCDKGEMIGVGKKYPAVAEGLWIQYNQLDPFVLEEWNDKVATA